MKTNSRTTCAVFASSLPLMMLALLYLGESIPGARDVVFLRKLAILDKVWRPAQPFRCLVGSSRILWQVNPEEMGGQKLTFNYALAGGGPAQSFFTLQRLIRLGRKPDQLVVEGWWYNLARENVRLHWYSLLSPGEQRQFRQWTGNAVESAEPTWTAAGAAEFFDWPVRYLFPEWDPEFAKPRPAVNAYGWTPPEPVEQGSEERERFQRVVREHRKELGFFPKADGGAAAMRSLLALGRAEHVPVVILLAPNSPGYRRALGEGHAKRESDFWSQLCRDSAARLLDTSSWGEDGDFLDGTHLRESKVAAYSRFLSEQLGPMPEK